MNLHTKIIKRCSATQKDLSHLEPETMVLRDRPGGELWPKSTPAQTAILSTAQVRQEMPLGVGRSLQPFLFMLLINILCVQRPYPQRGSPQPQRALPYPQRSISSAPEGTGCGTFPIRHRMQLPQNSTLGELIEWES